METFMWVALIGVVIVAIWAIVQLLNQPSTQTTDAPVFQQQEPEPIFPPETDPTQALAQEVKPFDPGPLIRDNINSEWDIEYVDRDGVVTSRRITVKALYGKKYPKFAKAWCHLRQEERHFNLYNMETAIEVSSGRKVPVTYQLIEFLDSHASRLHPVENPINLTITDTQDRVWAFEVQFVRAFQGSAHLQGHGKIIKSDKSRKWSGDKSFYPSMCKSIILTETGEDVGDVTAFLASLV